MKKKQFSKKGFVIDLQGVREVEICGLEDMQKAVGGYIERGLQLPNGDDVWVDEEGLLKDPEFWTLIKGAHQSFAGAVLILGARGCDSCDAKSTLEEIQKNSRCAEQLAVFGSGFPNE